MSTKRGGKRAGAGRKPNPVIPEVADKNAAARILDKVHGDRPHGKVKSKTQGSDKAEPEDCRCEFCYWWDLTHAQDSRLRLDAIKYLMDKRDGKAVNTVNHLHDKPIDLNLNVSLGERMRKAMEEGEKRVSSKRR